jgi:hypothetical protein
MRVSASEGIGGVRCDNWAGYWRQLRWAKVWVVTTSTFGYAYPIFPAGNLIIKVGWRVMPRNSYGLGG